jgi:hypothetical protein
MIQRGTFKSYFIIIRLLKLYEKGVLTKERYEFLISDDKWKHTYILHEAGVPPIHTPMKALISLSDDIKERLLLVHVAEKDGKKDNIYNFLVP